ncbi:MAG: hypothetical protein JWL77_4811 [Chthonomonadaceae bacterium]|nr:hypothetical protein [Chthonomonadaceae bacterium]
MVQRQHELVALHTHVDVLVRGNDALLCGRQQTLRDPLHADRIQIVPSQKLMHVGGGEDAAQRVVQCLLDSFGKMSAISETSQTGCRDELASCFLRKIKSFSSIALLRSEKTSVILSIEGSVLLEEEAI